MKIEVAPAAGGDVKYVKPTTTVPGFWDAFPRLATARWLTVRNDDVEGLMNQIQAEVTNLGEYPTELGSSYSLKLCSLFLSDTFSGLILALFSTMFLPLYYGEVCLPTHIPCRRYEGTYTGTCT
jgi:hypothetical protein